MTDARVLRVLIVDDDRDAASSLAKLIKLWGHESRVAHSGLAALAEAQVWRPNAAILDLGMRGLDGWEVARRLRTLPVCSGMLLIAGTGHARPEDQARSHEAGFTFHLTKPFDLEKLHAIVEALHVLWSEPPPEP